MESFFVSITLTCPYCVDPMLIQAEERHVSAEERLAQLEAQLDEKNTELSRVGILQLIKT